MSRWKTIYPFVFYLAVILFGVWLILTKQMARGTYVAEGPVVALTGLLLVITGTATMIRAVWDYFRAKRNHPRNDAPEKSEHP